MLLHSWIPFFIEPHVMFVWNMGGDGCPLLMVRESVRGGIIRPFGALQTHAWHWSAAALVCHIWIGQGIFCCPSAYIFSLTLLDHEGVSHSQKHLLDDTQLTALDQIVWTGHRFFKAFNMSCQFASQNAFTQVKAATVPHTSILAMPGISAHVCSFF